MPDTPEPTPAHPEPAEGRPALPAFTPVPRKCDRHNGWKPEVQRAFIEALADTGSVRAAARAVGRSEVGAYQLRRHPQGAEFAAAWEAALDHGVRRIEDVAMDRALNGVEVPVYAYGNIIGTRISYNDRLLMFILRNRAPERFCADGRARGLNAVDKMQVDQAEEAVARGVGGRAGGGRRLPGRGPRQHRAQGPGAEAPRRRPHQPGRLREEPGLRRPDPRRRRGRLAPRRPLPAIRGSRRRAAPRLPRAGARRIPQLRGSPPAPDGGGTGGVGGHGGGRAEAGAGGEARTAERPADTAAEG